MLPQYLIADNSQELPEKIFVIQTTSPRFIIEGNIEDISEDMIIHWLDDPEENQEKVSNLIAKAVEFYEKELDNQDLLFDEDED